MNNSCRAPSFTLQRILYSFQFIQKLKNMGLGKFKWESLFPISCFNPKTQAINKVVQRPQSSTPQRVSISDLSYPDGSDISISDLSNSIVVSNLFAFTHDELRQITSDFDSSNQLGGGGFGAVYKGFIDDKIKPGLSAQLVAVKVLDLKGSQGHKEWLAEVVFLGQLRHRNLVKLIGYCYENDKRSLVYEYMERGNLDCQLFKSYTPLPWLTRMKIALEAARGLAFLHQEEKPVIFRDVKAANILLSADYTAKLSDFGFATDGPEDDKTHVSTQKILGTEGYVAPEYLMTGNLTMMSDVYSFGVVLLELLTGRRCIDKSRPRREQSLVEWARPHLRDTQRLGAIMDPRLEGQYSAEGAKVAATVAYQCLSHQAKCRPTMGDVVTMLTTVLKMKDDIIVPFVYIAPCENKQFSDQKENAVTARRHRVGREQRSRVAHSDTEW